jgi:uncharacterized protein (TIGR00730 family)
MHLNLSKAFVVSLVSIFSVFPIWADLPARKITVHCGTSENVRAEYLQAATDLGHLLGPSNILLFGGAKVGLMGKVAEAALSKGAEIECVLAEVLRKFESALYQNVTKTWLPTLSERKQYFFRNSSVMIVLPGGVGTIDELMDLTAKKQLNEDNMYKKPLILLNINGFWDRLLEHLRFASQEGFIDSKHLDLIQIVNKVADIPAKLSQCLAYEAGESGAFDEKDHWWEKRTE